MVWLAPWIVATAFAGDKDKDSVPNKTDACLEEPEDADGFEDTDGCPDPDNDGDGLLDADDQCTGDAEDADGFEDRDGCPDPDNDQDGVLDADDKCASEKEDADDKDGCATVTFEMLTGTGYMAAISELSQMLLDAVGQQEAGCDLAASKSSAWLADNDAAALAAEWEGRMSRAPETIDKKQMTELLAQKGEPYRSLKTAIGIYCKEHAGWAGVAEKIDAVFAPLPVPEPPPPPKKKKR